MNLSFGAAGMLFGGLLVGVPILIHLLNRRRFVVQPFAAMRFLQEAFAKRRRRLHMESLLLLLLRCLIVLIAALAMALPFVPDTSPLALVSGGRQELVMIVDRSGSMGRMVAPGVTADDRVLSAVRRRIGRLSEERGDAVTLITMGSGPQLPAPIGATPSMALAALDLRLPAPGGVADLVGAARLLAERVRPVRPGRLEIVIVSDLQALSWSTAGGGLGALFAATLEEGGGTLRLMGTSGELPAAANAGVISLDAQSPLLLTGEPVTFTAVVRNWSEHAPIVTEGDFLLDGVRVARQTIELPPLGVTTAEVRLRVDSPGPHHLEFALAGDELPFDDRRTLAFSARDRLTVLLVDGVPGGADPLTSGTGYLSLALDPGGTDGLVPPRFDPIVQEVSRFEQAGADAERPDVIVLANVGGLSAAAAEDLARTVSSGTPLLIFLGDQVDAQLYAERLLPLGLLPAALGPVMGDATGTAGEDYVTISLPDPPPPSLALFADPRLAVLLQVPVFAWRELIPNEGSRVLASFADAVGHTTPAIVEGRLGRGRILMIGTSADARWSLLPRNPALWVPLVHELIGALAAPDPNATNLPVGQSPTLVVEGIPLSAQLTLPSGAVLSVERPASERVGERSVLELDELPLDEAGAYSLQIVTAENQSNPTTIALSALPDAREGDLRKVDDGTLSAVLSGVDWLRGGDLDDDVGSAGLPGDGSLSEALLWGLLALLLGEAVLARLVGRAR
jgi:hypothetical protein